MGQISRVLPTRAARGSETHREAVGFWWEEMPWRRWRWRQLGGGVGVPKHLSQVLTTDPQCPRVPVLRQHP